LSPQSYRLLRTQLLSNSLYSAEDIFSLIKK
jgi:hypothetical protein